MGCHCSRGFARSPNVSDTDISALLGKADEAGIEWARTVRARLEMENRKMTGMWPGTLTEASMLASRLLPREPSRTAHRDRDTLTKQVYAAAQRQWKQWRVPVPADP